MKKFNLNFVSQFPVAVSLSLLLVLGSVILLTTKGLRYGVDFKGGAEVQVSFASAVALSDIRTHLQGAEFSSTQVQSIGNNEGREYLIKVSSEENNLNQVTDRLTKVLLSKFAANNAEIQKTDIVGPKAGEQLRISGFQAMLWALLMIMIYIALRFDYKYSPGAIVALIHDIVIILGVFVVMEKEFSLQIVGALLAVIGYSVNDTVVIYDRVREEEQRSLGAKLKDNINRALNDTLSRTILTSITTFMVAIIMFMFGGGIIHDFFFVICLGVIIGTYSSLYVAAPTILFFEKLSKK